MGAGTVPQIAVYEGLVRHFHLRRKGFEVLQGIVVYADGDLPF